MSLPSIYIQAGYRQADLVNGAATQAGPQSGGRASRQANKAAGFTLIEVLVAMVILALSLGVLYQAAAGATRNVRLDERYTYAIQIAQSLLDEYRQLPPGGVNRSGFAGEDFYWRIDSAPVPVPMMPGEMDMQFELHEVRATVGWDEGAASGREVRLVTVAPVMRLDPESLMEPPQ